jgi:uncharacterized protein YdeI (YjbR/CyaY-like superfamily)
MRKREPMKTDESEQICPESPKDWREWLENNHKNQNSVWVLFHKMKSPQMNMTWSQAVDEALCYGWIDGRKQSIDEMTYRQYFSRRKQGSTWSKINKDKIDRLTAEGRMSEAGLSVVEKAKADGSWNLLDSVDALIIPDDLDRKLKEDPSAYEYYNALSSSKKKMIQYWIISAKRQETRRKRVEQTALSLAEGQMPVS